MGALLGVDAIDLYQIH
jgi:aryl-alcohol dehydrogenase-like predicted oxidoreductase